MVSENEVLVVLFWPAGLEVSASCKKNYVNVIIRRIVLLFAYEQR